MSFLSELKRRNVFKVGVAYVIVAWLLIQVASILFPTFHAPDWVMQVLTAIVILGFPIVLIFAWAFEITPEGIKPTQSVAPAESITRITGQKLNYTIIGLMALVIVFLVIDNYVLKETPEVTKETAATPNVRKTVVPAPAKVAETAPTVPPNSIAVLPFKDMSPDKDQEYFADGIAEELLNQLAQVSGLQVAGRTSSFSFKGKDEDLRVIGEKLGVANILEGSVRKAGNKVRITTQLIKAVDGYHLWSETYDRTLDDIFTIQDDIARSVANALQLTLGVGKLGQLPGMTRNVAAFDAFLAGRSLLRKLGRENVSRAIENLEQAVAVDPEFAIGWITLANAYDLAGGAGWIPEREEEYRKKAAAARARAVELAPEASFALQIKAAQSGDLMEVERLQKHALDQAPGDFDTNTAYGQFLRSVGRPTEAIEYFQRAVRLEPLSSTSYLQLALDYEFSGNVSAAITAMKRGAELADQPAVYNSGLLVLALEENDRASIEKYLSLVLNTELLGDINRTETRDVNEVMGGLLDKPEAAVSELKKFLNDPAYANPFNRGGIATWASYFGAHDLALEIWQEISDRTFQTFWRPLHKPMRKLPGFKNLMVKSGYVDYWRKSGNWGDFCHPLGENDFECN